MAIYRANIEVVLEVDNDAEAADLMSDILTGQMRKFGNPESLFLDWHYTTVPFVDEIRPYDEEDIL